MAFKKSIFKRLQQLPFFDTFRNISTYFSAQVAIQALGIISLPVYTYFMDEADYGIANVYVSYALVLTIILGANLHGAVSRYYYEEREDFQEFMGTTVISTLFMYLLTCLLVFTFREAIATYINLPVRVIPWLLGFSLMSAIFNVYQQILVPQKESKLFSGTQVGMHYFKFTLACVGLYLMTEHIYMGKIMGDFVAMIFVSGFMLYKIYPYVKLTFKIAHLKYILHYAIPLIPFILSGYILHSFDQWFINASVGNVEAGLYSFAYKIGFLLSGFVAALLAGSNPDYYKWMNRKEQGAVDKQVVSLTKLLVVATAFLILFAVDMGTLLSAKAAYREALPLVPIIVGGYFFYGITHLFFRGIYFLKRNIYLTIIVLLAGGLNVILNYIYIHQFGYGAAAYTTLVSYFVMLMLTWITTSLILKLPPLPMRRIFELVGMLLLMVLIFYYFVPQGNISIGNILLKTGLFGLLALAVYGKNFRDLLSAKN